MNFTQIEIERELSDAFPQGKRSVIAGNAHIYPSVLLGWFNPDDERKSPHLIRGQWSALKKEIDISKADLGPRLLRTGRGEYRTETGDQGHRRPHDVRDEKRDSRKRPALIFEQDLRRGSVAASSFPE